MSVRDSLKLVIVGHVDHGKSTLIGRLCLDSGSIPDSKMEEIIAASKATGGQLELGYIMDHLEEERTRAMTIDTAETFFRSGARDYNIIDAPGHKELTRNMITGASHADAAILVLDAAEGVQEQTRRHAYLLSLLGIEQIVVLVNKMDAVGWDVDRFNALAAQIHGILSSGGTKATHVVPGSARHGDNIIQESKQTPWYKGPTLMRGLDQFTASRRPVYGPLRLPLQDVYDIDGKRIYVGRIESGTVEAGSNVKILPSGETARVVSVEMLGEHRTSAVAGESIGLVLDARPGIDRGDVVCGDKRPPAVTKRFRASVFWMAGKPLARGEELTLRLATQDLSCRAEAIEDRMDSSTLERLEKRAEHLQETEVGQVTLDAEKPVVVEPFSVTPGLGRFVLERSGEVVGGGVVTHEGDLAAKA